MQIASGEFPETARWKRGFLGPGHLFKMFPLAVVKVNALTYA